MFADLAYDLTWNLARYTSSDVNFSTMHLLEPQLSYHADFESESNRCLHSGNPTDTSFQLNQSGSPGIWMLTNINLSLLLSLILTQDLKLDRPICWSIHVMSFQVVSEFFSPLVSKFFITSFQTWCWDSPASKMVSTSLRPCSKSTCSIHAEDLQLTLYIFVQIFTFL